MQYILIRMPVIKTKLKIRITSLRTRKNVILFDLLIGNFFWEPHKVCIENNCNFYL